MDKHELKDRVFKTFIEIFFSVLIPDIGIIVNQIIQGLVGRPAAVCCDRSGHGSLGDMEHAEAAGAAAHGRDAGTAAGSSRRLTGHLFTRHSAGEFF